MRGGLVAAGCIVTILITLCACERESSPALITNEEKRGYSIGYRIGTDLKVETPDLEPALLLQGVLDGLRDAEPLLSEQEIEDVRKEFIELRKAAKAAKHQAEADKNLQEAERFLRENGKREGVVELPSGLQYRVVEQGRGAVPTLEDNVKVHYRGTFIDGTEFGNTYAEDRPAVFPVARVIPGWTEALQMMNEGARWELFVSPHLAYGESGAGEIIGPNKTLIFDLEFIAIH